MSKLTTALKMLALLSMTAGPVLADETVPEKVKDSANDTKRAARKGVNRVDEKLCTGTKAECAAGKAKHRANEAKDSVKDGAENLKDKVD